MGDDVKLEAGVTRTEAFSVTEVSVLCSSTRSVVCLPVSAEKHSSHTGYSVTANLGQCTLKFPFHWYLLLSLNTRADRSIVFFCLFLFDCHDLNQQIGRQLYMTSIRETGDSTVDETEWVKPAK